MFMLSTAVDALVDGDPQLPPNHAPYLAQMGLMIEKLVDEKNGKLPQKETEKMKYMYREIARIDAGDDVVPYLHRRTDCVCLEARALCQGCHQVVPKGTLKLCAGCTVACFCSRECQKAAWKRDHKRNCKKTKEMLESGFLA